MKRIKLSKGSVMVSDDVPQKIVDILNQMSDLAYNDETKQCDIHSVSGSCCQDAIMHYDKLIKTKLELTFEPLRDHGTHADFCNKINDLREEAKSNYR